MLNLEHGLEPFFGRAHVGPICRARGVPSGIQDPSGSGRPAGSRGGFEQARVGQ
jgi:hypothetical protein